MKNNNRNILRQKDYRQILVDELVLRKNKNAKYSERAFARDLNISSSTLNDIFNKRSGLSLEKAKQIAEILNFSTKEKNYFCDLVESQHARSQKLKQAAALRLTQYDYELQYKDTVNVVFNIFLKWHYSAVFVMLSAGESNLKKIEKKLRIPEEDVRAAVRELISMGFISEGKNGEYKVQHISFFGESTKASTIIRNFHKQCLMQALRAIDEQANEERHFLSTIFLLENAQLSEAKKKLDLLHKDFVLQNESERFDKAEAYCLSYGLFKVGGQNVS